MLERWSAGNAASALCRTGMASAGRPESMRALPWLLRVLGSEVAGGGVVVAGVLVVCAACVWVRWCRCVVLCLTVLLPEFEFEPLPPPLLSTTTSTATPAISKSAAGSSQLGSERWREAGGGRGGDAH